MGDGLKAAGRGLDERLLFAPLHTLSGRKRWWIVLAAVVGTVGWSAWLGGDLMTAWGLPDVAFYVDMAHRRVDLVPQPFSARPLAPLLARWIAAAGGFWVQGGFTVLAYLSLAWTAGVVFWLALRTRAPRWVLLALVSVPFWPALLVHAGLPDPLYAALLAGVLVALERGWMMGAAGLMFPLMLARESTSLTLVCLLLVGWRRLGWRGGALAVAGAVAGAAVVHRMSAGGLPNPEGMSGGLYMVGKVVANLFRSVGVVPWSNVYPELCGAPVWRAGLRVGPVREVGVCGWSPIAPLQALGALLTTFGLLPVLLFRGGRKLWEVWRQGDDLLRFSVLYGGVSLVLGPALGTWYQRLFGYGWPLLLVAAPRLAGMWEGSRREPLRRQAEGGLLGLHLVVCGLGTVFLSGGRLAWVVVLEAVAVALLLVHRRSSAGVVDGRELPSSAW